MISVSAAQTLYTSVGHIPAAYQETWNEAGLLRDMSQVEPKLVIVITAGNAISQVTKSGSDAIFFDIGFGKSPNLFNGKGTSLAVFAYFSKNNHLFSARSLGNVEYFLKAGPEPIESYSDLSLLWGYKVVHNRNKTFAPLIGLANVTTIKRGKLLDEYAVNAKHEKLKEKAMGFSAGIKFQLNTKYTGYSFYFFSNYNRIKSYYGILICLGFGKYN